MCGCMGAWVDGWVGGGGRIDAWTDGWMVRVCVGGWCLPNKGQLTTLASLHP